MNVFLTNKYFRTFSIAELLSGAGDALFYLALITYASKLHNYSLALSLIAISAAITQVLNAIAGYYADKTAKKTHSHDFVNYLAFYPICLYWITLCA